MSQLILTQEPKRFSRDEMNLAEFPLSVLSTRSNPKTKTLEFSDSVKSKNGDLIDRKWIITGADKFGLPTASDDEVLLGLLKLTVDSEMRSPKVYFTRYEILKILKWTTEGRSYSRLQKALDRLSGVRIKATNAFYDNDTKLHSTKNFGIVDGYEINDGRDDNKKSFFIWSEVLFKSFQVGFIKKLDLDFYLVLKSSISKRLYRYLDKHFWYKSKIQMNLLTFAHEKIGISRNYRFMSSLRQQLDPAIEELIEKGFLGGCEYIGRGAGAEIVLYAAKDKAKISSVLPEERKSEKKGDKTIFGEQLSVIDADLSNGIFQMLQMRGIKAPQIEKLLLGKSNQEMQRMLSIIEYYDQLQASGSSKISRSPIGFLYRAIENPNSFILPGESSAKNQQTSLKLSLEREVSVNGIRSSVNKEKKLTNQKVKTTGRENEESKYLTQRKEKINEIKVNVEKEFLDSIRREVRAALQKLKGLISESRFEEAVEHGVEERLAKLFALPDFSEWLKSR